MTRSLLIAPLVSASALTACGQVGDMKPAKLEDGTAAVRPNDTPVYGVTTALAADNLRKALRRDADTQEGQVALTGTAPGANAAPRATALAQSIDGVRAVAKRLVVGSKG